MSVGRVLDNGREQERTTSRGDAEEQRLEPKFGSLSTKSPAGDKERQKEQRARPHVTDATSARSRALRKPLIAVLVSAALASAALLGWWWFSHPKANPNELILHGNIDLRQVALPFNNNERIAEVRVREGDHVRKGQLLARLDVGRLKPQVDQVAAQVEAQRAVVERLHNGSRPEEIAQAKANLEAAKADAFNARRQAQRKTVLLSKDAGTQQDADVAEAAAGVSDARVEVNQKAFDLAVVGPRREDIEQAEAQLRGMEARLSYLNQQLADARLLAPLDAVVHSRLMEPGEMASPQRPVFSLAIIDPKWVRTYVNATDLGKVHTGMPANVSVDSFPGRKFEGWVGFVSPVAEFTPKTVETTELRTSLLYEIRVFVKDPGDQLPLGMPADVRLDLNAQPTDRVDRP